MGGQHGSRTPSLRTSSQTWPWSCAKVPSMTPRIPSCRPRSDISSALARVPDCVQLLPFEQLREAFHNYTAAATTIGLVRLHRGNVLFLDIYFQFFGEHFTIMGLWDPTIQFGMADEFVGGYLVHWHVNSSGWKAHAMLPPGYV